EFYTPHYHIGARRVELVGREPVAPFVGGALRSGSFRIRDATLNIDGRPILYWPYIGGPLGATETAIKRARTGFSDEFGLELETDWDLLSVLGLETPAGFDATLSLDYFSERGPAIGADARYQRDDYFGVARTYVLTDNDEDNLGRQRERVGRRDLRGRVLVRHRHYLEDDWELTFELSYLSDRTFLEEFFEPEFDRDKAQETLLYLKKQRDDWAATVHLQWRILDFLTQTERLPDVSYFVIGRPLGERVTLFGAHRIGSVRLRGADQTFRELLLNGRSVSSGTTARVDTRHEATMPLDLGPVRIVPFVSLRGSAWSDTPGGGGVTRFFGVYGLRGSMYLSRVFPDATSDLFDIDGIRHIVKPHITAWMSHTNQDADQLFPFDERVEGVDEIDGVTLGLRQRWQTKRGIGDGRRVVDLVTFAVEAGVFNDAPGTAVTNGFTSFSRPETSLARNFVNSSFIWRMNDRTAIANETNWDLNDGELDILNVSMVVDRPPRLSYLVGYRFINEIDSNLMAFEANYQLNEKHTLAVREQFDLDRGRTLDFTIGLIRRLPRWYAAVSFALDEPEDDFGVSLSIWPEGLPQAALGHTRFTGVTNVTTITRN
ncbi:MAG: LPS assembly protein LptD, partial [Phycisphaerae bacterium]